MDGEGKRPPLLDVRNFGVMAHIDAGKTTTTERILFYSGRIHEMGEVHEGETVMDYMKEERERGITITSAATQTAWKGNKLNIIDTPGHVDFTAEVERSLRVLDGAVCVFDAKEGVEPQSETVWRQANRYKVPRICFLNKMDKPGADFDLCLNGIRKRLGANAIPVQYPIGTGNEFEGIIDIVRQVAIYFDAESEGRLFVEKPVPEAYLDKVECYRRELIEACAEQDDKLMERYFAGETIEHDQIYAAMRKGVVKGLINPLLVGSALRNKGVQHVLDAVCRYLPCPDRHHLDQGLAPRHEGGDHAPGRRDRRRSRRSRSRSSPTRTATSRSSASTRARSRRATSCGTRCATTASASRASC